MELNINTVLSFVAIALSLKGSSDVKEQIEQTKKDAEKLQNQVQASLISLQSNVDEQLEEAAGSGISGLTCNVRVIVSSLANKYWDSQFYLDIKNNSKYDFSFTGVRLSWRYNGAMSVWLPYALGNWTIHPNQTITVRLSGTNNKLLFESKEVRKSVSAKLRKEGVDSVPVEADATFLAYVKGINKSTVQYLEDIQGTMTWVKSKSFKNGKNGIEIDEFDAE